ncbi:hypothetical protein B0H19DRAFT_1059269 [Mycena capillaripes]|nr:hypothetical protein B0H19DRAFT_1059269 [Mycena capillaripes]
MPTTFLPYSSPSVSSSPPFMSRLRTRALATLEPESVKLWLDVAAIARAHVETHLAAEEIFARRSKSADLVESIFGYLVDVDGAADILLDFLEMPILSVHQEVDGKLQDVAKKDRKAACAAAASQANEAVTPSKPSPADKYRWTWGLKVAASETMAALFLNVVAIAAHAAAIRSGKARDLPLPSLRFITLPDPHQPVPLSNESVAQDCRPDVVAFDYSAFCEVPNISASANRFLLQNCPFEYIRKNLPAVLRFTTAHKSTDGPAIFAFEQWFKEQEKRNYLDMSRFCWPEAQLTVEAKLSDLHNAILQELVYMRQQRRTQPWMRSTLGLVMTTKIVGILRADSLGIEQCTFSRDCSRGVLDTVRICLGLVRSNCLQRGQHEAFELSDTTTLAPPHLKTKPSKTQPSKTGVDSDLDVFGAEAPAVEYIHRTARKPDVTYYVHHLVQDNGSLVGRCPRIFCVSRKTESKDTVRRFVGPYALKVYYVDHASECYKEDLISQARDAQVQNVLLPTWEWHYGDALSMRGFPLDIVKKYTDTQAVAVVPNVVSNREEVFAQSDLKRLLVQCSGYEEFAKAFIDFVGGIASLAEQDITHRDLSIGNVLLSKDFPCSPSFLSDAAASAEALLGSLVTFTQRPLEQRMGGLIHDLDMAGRVHHLPEKSPTDDSKSNANLLEELFKTAAQPEQPAQSVGLQKEFRTLHSLLFVMALFFWSHSTFLSNSEVPFPQFVPARRRKWPREVLRWANRPVGFTLAELGALKRGFFSMPRTLRETLQTTLRGDLWTENSEYLDFFWGVYITLWRPLGETLDSEWHDRHDVRPVEVEAALRAKIPNPPTRVDGE